ncbi:MAG TPA: GspH/FimT family pseudopilin [Burkholderiaceae bacterium]|jgi:type IV fimbrial biogenesis protein FimT
MKTQRTRRQHGVTLIEASIVVTIGAILAASALPSWQETMAARRLNNVASGLADDLRLARSSAVARNQALRVSFYARNDGSCYVIHTGAANQCDCAAAGPAACSGGAQALKTVVVSHADHVVLASNVASMRFDPLHGTVTPTGTVRLMGANGRELHDVVNIVGRVRTCSAAPAVPGFVAC